MAQQPEQLKSNGFRVRTADSLVKKGAPEFTLLVAYVMASSGLELNTDNNFNANKE